MEGEVGLEWQGSGNGGGTQTMDMNIKYPLPE